MRINDCGHMCLVPGDQETYLNMCNIMSHVLGREVRR